MSTMRALHPAEAALLRRIRPALVRAINATRRVEERALAVQDAQRIGDDVITRHTRHALDLATSVQALADRTLTEALCEAYGIAANGAEGDLENVLAHSLAVVEGGKGKRS